MGEWFTVTRVDQLGPGRRDVFDIEGYYIVVFNVGGRYYAVEDQCTHDDDPLSEGHLDGYQIECPRHGARFDIRTGEALSLPAVRPTRHFDVRVEGNEVQVLIED